MDNESIERNQTQSSINLLDEDKEIDSKGVSKASNGKLKSIAIILTQLLFGCIFVFIGVIYPFKENHSIPNGQVTSGVLIDTQVASHYSQEELNRLRGDEVKKHGIYEFKIKNSSFKTKDSQTSYKIKKSTRIIYNKFNPSQCMVKIRYVRVLPITLIGIFLILHAVFPSKVALIIDRFFSKL